MSKRLSLAAVALTLGLLAGGSEALAHRFSAPGSYGPMMSPWGYRHRPHAYVGGLLMGTVIVSQETSYTNGYLGHGGGGGLFAGVRIGPFFAVEGTWRLTYHNETSTSGDFIFVDLDALYMMTFSVDGKVHLPTRGPVEPYFQAGLGYALLGATYGAGYVGDTAFANGFTFNLGGGFDLWLSRWLTVGGRVLYRGTEFSGPSAARNNAYANYVSAVSFDANMAFHF